MKILKKWHDTDRDYGSINCRLILNDLDEIIQEVDFPRAFLAAGNGTYCDPHTSSYNWGKLASVKEKDVWGHREVRKEYNRRFRA
jgi:hypothetical protein